MDGKFFATRDGRFDVRAVSYGTFAPREDGALYPDRDRVKLDFAAIRDAGFNTVRTYTVPPDDVLDLAADADLRLLSDVFYRDWRYVIGSRSGDRRRVERDARAALDDALRLIASRPEVMALSLGNEIPADAVRWFGADSIVRTITDLAETVRDADPDLLVTYANYPSAEYLPLDMLDFLTFNVYLERRHDLRKYLTHLQTLAGDRPLMLGEIGFHAGTTAEGATLQADVLDWHLATAVERGVAGTCVFSWTDDWHVGGQQVEGWHFGLTDGDRTPRQALEAAARWNGRTVRDVEYPWPSISIVICAYNAAATLDECLTHTCRLDYPHLEILVVDDGSTDETAAIARRHPRVRLVSIPHAGLSVARNEGFRKASGRVVAYLDSDAFPTPEWPYFLALGFDSHRVGGVGGPNVPPADSGFGELVVARSPGGPVHVLTSDDRAEHVPGCNMAFYREVLAEVGGFDPIYTSAGDDVDLCWRVLDRGWELGFHPAALVWHRRRSGLRPYLRQQQGYGRSEALVEARHPDRFTPTGTARWRGRIYDSFSPALRGGSIYRGLYGSAPFQSVYRGGGHLSDLAHQVGIPVATVAALTAPLGMVTPWLLLPAVIGVAFVVLLALLDAGRARPPRALGRRRLTFRMAVAVHHVLQPLVRTWGRSRHRRLARAEVATRGDLPARARRFGATVLIEADRPRTDLVRAVVDHVRQRDIRVVQPTGWESHDARLLLSTLVAGDLVSSAFPEHWVQLRIAVSARWRRVGLALVATAVGLLIHPAIGLAVAAATIADIALGVVRGSRLVSSLFPESGSRAAR